ncbi:proteasome component region PCI domain-containing protein [Tieghemostelium lacteum]|uniref:Eukaryotic translation initiation factor 3 subunit E n=1 Tax=Tieghemostelium lacteum TaxID=361077 RepID=A0A152A235_TIELA|nr:proteasome component region PCI domain-containing protein [Tieghemostelium lacteum]|eukprot:KYR00313.1 proteasome component region PCI domain-containing protein [Tieghemostelium lacteum]
MEYDLTKQLCTFLDAHMMLPLIDFLKSRSIYPEDQVNKAKVDIIEQTGRFEDAIQFFESIGRDTTEINQRKVKTTQEITDLTKECEVILQYIESKKQPEQAHKTESAVGGEEVTTSQVTSTTASATLATTPSTVISMSTNISVLYDKVTANLLQSLYKLAKLTFEQGKYKQAKDLLEVFVLLNPGSDKHLSALWGMLESDILSGNWVGAVGGIASLKQQIDVHGTPVDQLYQRAWLVHRSLFIYFNYQENKSLLFELFLDEKYLIAIQTACPHILRYLAVAIINNKRRQQSMLFQRNLNTLVRIIEQEAYTYRDPVTLFIHNLYVKFNFEEAQNQLSQAEKVLANDYFLASGLEDFMENARVCIFETYCNIHENIDIDMLSKNLGISENPEKCERWIVEAIRQARFNAKIDSANNQIKMFSQHNNSYRQVINKTKPLFNLGIEIVVGINDSKSQQSRKLDQNNRQNKNRQNRQSNQNNQTNQSNQSNQSNQNNQTNQTNQPTVAATN